MANLSGAWSSFQSDCVRVDRGSLLIWLGGRGERGDRGESGEGGGRFPVDLDGQSR